MPRSEPASSPTTEASLPAQISERAQRDLDGTLAWLAHLGSDEERQNWIALALIEASRHLPGLAAGRLSSLQDQALRLEVMDKVIGEWAALDFAAALSWADGQVDAVERSAGLGAAFRSLGETNPAATLRAAEAVMGPSYDFHRLAFTVLQSWTQDAPRDALNWAATRLEPPLRQQAFSSFLTSWAENAPDQATEWVLSLPEPQVRADALAAIGAGGS